MSSEVLEQPTILSQAKSFTATVRLALEKVSLLFTANCYRAPVGTLAIAPNRWNGTYRPHRL